MANTISEWSDGFVQLIMRLEKLPRDFEEVLNDVPSLSPVERQELVHEMEGIWGSFREVVGYMPSISQVHGDLPLMLGHLVQLAGYLPSLPLELLQEFYSRAAELPKRVGEVIGRVPGLSDEQAQYLGERREMCKELAVQTQDLAKLLGDVSALRGDLPRGE